MVMFLMASVILFVGMAYIASFIFNVIRVEMMKRSFRRVLLAVVCIIPPINFVFTAYWITQAMKGRKSS